MAQQLCIDLTRPGLVRWRHPQSGPGQGALEEVPAPGRAEVVVIVPGDQVLIVPVRLPGRNRQRQRQALPFALEEQLAQDIEQYHFALGPSLRDGRFLAAAVAKEAMAQWTRALEEAGLVADVIVPAPLTLPAGGPGEVVVAVLGAQALVRVEERQAFQCAVGDLDTLLALEGNLSQVKLSDPDGAWPGAGLEVQAGLAVPFDPTAAVKAPALNLLQGAYQAQGEDAAQVRRLWRRATVALACAGALAIALQYLGYVQAKDRVTQLEQAAATLLHQALPDAEAGTDPRAVLARELGQLQGSSGNGQAGFLYLLESVGAEVAGQSGVRLSAVTFRSDGLLLELEAEVLDQVEGLRRAISDLGGVPVTIESAANTPEGTQARLRIGRPAP